MDGLVKWVTYLKVSHLAQPGVHSSLLLIGSHSAARCTQPRTPPRRQKNQQDGGAAPPEQRTVPSSRRRFFPREGGAGPHKIQKQQSCAYSSFVKVDCRSQKQEDPTPLSS